MPYATALVVHLIAGKVFDCCRKKQFCSLTVLRKIFNTIGGQPERTLIAKRNGCNVVLIFGQVSSYRPSASSLWAS